MESTVGIGSNFLFELPLVAGPANSEVVPSTMRTLAGLSLAVAQHSAPAVIESAPPASKAVEQEEFTEVWSRLLVVDDNAVNRKVASAMLGRLGFHVTLASSAQEALDLVSANEFDLILMDVQMPGMDGLEATAEIRRRNVLRHGRPIQIIALTAHAMIGDSDRCIEAGMDGYLTKPIRSADLQLLLKQLGPAPTTL